jgi:hypothetical protein
MKTKNICCICLLSIFCLLFSAVSVTFALWVRHAASTGNSVQIWDTYENMWQFDDADSLRIASAVGGATGLAVTNEDAQSCVYVETVDGGGQSGLAIKMNHLPTDGVAALYVTLKSTAAINTYAVDESQEATLLLTAAYGTFTTIDVMPKIRENAVDTVSALQFSVGETPGIGIYIDRIEVVYGDVVAPVITLVSQPQGGYASVVGETVDLSDYVSGVTDNSGESVAVSYAATDPKGQPVVLVDDSKLELLRIGDYTVTVSAEDSSENIGTATFTLISRSLFVVNSANYVTLVEQEGGIGGRTEGVYKYTNVNAGNNRVASALLFRNASAMAAAGYDYFMFDVYISGWGNFTITRKANANGDAVTDSVGDYMVTTLTPTALNSAGIDFLDAAGNNATTVSNNSWYTVKVPLDPAYNFLGVSLWDSGTGTFSFYVGDAGYYSYTPSPYVVNAAYAEIGPAGEEIGGRTAGVYKYTNKGNQSVNATVLRFGGSGNIAANGYAYLVVDFYMIEGGDLRFTLTTTTSGVGTSIWTSGDAAVYNANGIYFLDSLTGQNINTITYNRWITVVIELQATYSGSLGVSLNNGGDQRSLCLSEARYYTASQFANTGYTEYNS